jgi:hypothetical protein
MQENQLTRLSSRSVRLPGCKDADLTSETKDTLTSQDRQSNHIGIQQSYGDEGPLDSENTKKVVHSNVVHLNSSNIHAAAVQRG